MVWGGEVVDKSGLVGPQTSGRQKGAGLSAGGVESVDLYLKQVGLTNECFQRVCWFSNSSESHVKLPSGCECMCVFCGVLSLPAS